MPDDKRIEFTIENIGVSSWVTSLAAALNETYSYSNSTLFLSVLPGYYKDYGYRYLRPAVQWLDGFVPLLHNNGTGVISTRIASKLISGLTKQLCGEQLVFRRKSKEDAESLEALRAVSDWANKQQIHKAIKNGIGYAFGLGTSLVKINRRSNGDIWWEPVRFDNCFYLSSFTGEIKEATFLIRGYTDTRQNKGNAQYFLCEKRYYQFFKGKIKQYPDGRCEVLQKQGIFPVVEYKVHRAVAQSLNNLMASSTGRSAVGWEEIPYEIRKMIKSDYSMIRIDEPQILPFPNLGVEAFINGEGDISIPTGSNFGESMIIGIQDDLITYEIASSYLIRDMNNGKGTIYTPKSMSMGDVIGTTLPPIADSPESNAPNGDQDFTSVTPSIEKSQPVAPIMPVSNPWESTPNSPVETLKGVAPEDQQAIVQQFEVRAAEWQLIKENSLKNIAVKWGMSPKILSSFLAQTTGQMTATQIDSEDDISIAFINLHRSYFKQPINNLLETTLNYMGFAANIECRFASPSLINKDRLLNRVMQEVQAGFLTLDEAIRELNPDLDEEALQTKIDKIMENQQSMLLANMTNMNEVGGGFGDADAYKGSTIPR